MSKISLPKRTFSPRQFMGDRGIPCNSGRALSITRTSSTGNLNKLNNPGLSSILCPQPLRIPVPCAAAPKKNRKVSIGEAEACEEIQRILSTNPRLLVLEDGSRRADSAPLPIRPSSSLSGSSSPEMEEPSSLCDSTSDLCLALCPSPSDSSKPIFPNVLTPPVRCSNPIVINSNFTRDKLPSEGAQLGLLSVSPLPRSRERGSYNDLVVSKDTAAGTPPITISSDM
eukprot:TRINITY_DN5944_c0_g1_i1.p1 TRINITY_DN5944_c0_g1~~TRINITY_DN5944_c0_g1_i1.p1  ORF type:complete len:258 (-),score=39.73 TRINITY_DN5944_c0_g1_i1:115-795(-)